MTQCCFPPYCHSVLPHFQNHHFPDPRPLQSSLPLDILPRPHPRDQPRAGDNLRCRRKPCCQAGRWWHRDRGTPGRDKRALRGGHQTCSRCPLWVWSMDEVEDNEVEVEIEVDKVDMVEVLRM